MGRRTFSWIFEGTAFIRVRSWVKLELNEIDAIQVQFIVQFGSISAEHWKSVSCISSPKSRSDKIVIMRTRDESGPPKARGLEGLGLERGFPRQPPSKDTFANTCVKAARAI
jgi:hypothetical protein